MREELGEITIQEFGKVKKLPCYVCGHCNNIITLNPARSRERKRCPTCWRLICEKTDICRNHCTPLHEMAKDHFQDAGEHGMYVPAIMQGVTSIKEAHMRGLVKEK